MAKIARKGYTEYWNIHDPYIEPWKGELEKRCASCGLVKDIREFNVARKERRGLNSYCKQCIAERAKNNPQYSAKWRKNNPEKANKYSREWMRKSGYNSSLKQKRGQFRVRNIKSGFGELDFSYEELIEWNKKQLRRCHYCHCPEEIVLSGKWNRRKYHDKRTETLTFDRKDNDKGYELSNLCLACDVCNVVKGNIFGEVDFMEIAQKYIKPKWKKLHP